MRIAKMHVPLEKAEKVGLKEINLTKKPLGPVVALVGKNGSGKSRILKFVEEYFETISYDNLFNDYIIHFPKEISSSLIRAKDHHKRNASSVRSLNPFINEVAKFLRLKGKGFVKYVDNDNFKKIEGDLVRGISFEKILLYRNNEFNLNEFEIFNSHKIIPYLNKLITEISNEEIKLYWKNKKNPDIIEENIKRNKAYKLFLNFQQYIKEFLGKEFSYEVDQDDIMKSSLRFDDKPFDIAQLSPGQQTLFSYAILFFFLDVNTETNIKDSIIIIDELEKHLHPEAQIQLIDSIRNIISNTGQLWIATHSVNILAHLDYDEILMVKDDEIMLPSRLTPGNSYNELMGLDRHTIKLFDFINSISEWAYGNFMIQCFKEPESVFSNDKNDLQYLAFKKMISSKNIVTLLDYGAGKGRIGHLINEDDEMKSVIQYHAFEPDKDNFDSLQKIPNSKIYKDENKIPNDFFDCVLLCNVLHEINPLGWEKIFNQIKQVLKPNGFLLILEDRYLPKGECAHPFGYLILDSEQLKILFNSDSHSNSKILEFSLKDGDYSDRIIFNAFTRDQIHVSHESIMAAIKSLEESAYENIKELRKEAKKDIHHGRQYANQTQLYINAQLALEELEKEHSNIL